jgi:hypothetical protein
MFFLSVTISKSSEEKKKPTGSFVMMLSGDTTGTGNF